ncbi:hypothetical protein C8R45DRAFT_1017755 [Mycena sanguinolenta]|nr:hypothetical protein C8R45DRAFT_1017755 [Mycena sanguinolenta]
MTMTTMSPGFLFSYFLGVALPRWLSPLPFPRCVCSFLCRGGRRGSWVSRRLVSVSFSYLLALPSFVLLSSLLSFFRCVGGRTLANFFWFRLRFHFVQMVIPFVRWLGSSSPRPLILISFSSFHRRSAY